MLQQPGPTPHKTIAPRKIHIAAIHHIERSGFENQLIQHGHIALFPLGNRDHRRNRAAQIQQRVELDRRLGGTKPRPRKQTQAEINRRRVQRVNGLLQLHAKGLAGVKTAGAGDQSLGQIVVDAPVAFAVGVGQSAMGDGGTKAQPIELVLTRAQADFDVRQAIPVSDLHKGHGQELVPTREVISSIPHEHIGPSYKQHKLSGRTRNLGNRSGTKGSGGLG